MEKAFEIGKILGIRKDINQINSIKEVKCKYCDFKHKMCDNMKNINDYNIL